MQKLYTEDNTHLWEKGETLVNEAMKYTCWLQRPVTSLLVYSYYSKPYVSGIYARLCGRVPSRVLSPCHKGMRMAVDAVKEGE